MQLEEPILLDEYQRPIGLSGAEFDKVLIKSGTHVVASGWGSSYNGSLPTQLLQKLDTKIISNKECIEKDSHISSSIICTHNMPGYNICQVSLEIFNLFISFFFLICFLFIYYFSLFFTGRQWWSSGL